MGHAPSVAVLGSLIIFGKCYITIYNRYITVTDSNIYIHNILMFKNGWLLICHWIWGMRYTPQFWTPISHLRNRWVLQIISIHFILAANSWQSLRDRSYSVTQRHRCRSRYLSMSCKSMGPLPQHYTARRTLNGFASVSSVYVSMRSGGSDACAPRKFFLTVPRELCCNLFNSQALLEFHYLLSTSKTRCYAWWIPLSRTLGEHRTFTPSGIISNASHLVR